MNLFVVENSYKKIGGLHSFYLEGESNQEYSLNENLIIKDKELQFNNDCIKEKDYLAFVKAVFQNFEETLKMINKAILLDQIKTNRKILYHDPRNGNCKALVRRIQYPEVMIENLKTGKTHKIDIYEIKEFYPLVSNYKTNEKLKEYDIQINGTHYAFSIHAQKRIIERKILKKEELKETISNIKSSFKILKKRNNINELLKYDVKARVLYNKKYNLVLVINHRQKVILTAFPFLTSKHNKK